MIKAQYNVVIKRFCCDLGNEYISNKLYGLLTYDGTIHRTYVIYTFQQNIVIGKKCCQLLRQLILLCCLLWFPLNFEGEDVLIVIHVIKRISSFITSGLYLFEILYSLSLIIFP